MARIKSLLTARERKIERAFTALVRRREKDCVVHYLARYGRVIDTDAAREFCVHYRASAKSRTKWSRATYKPAKYLANRVYAHILASAKFWSKRAQIIFTSGGSGTGKTTARASLPLEKLVSIPSPDDKALGVVMDGTLSNFDQAQVQIGQALAEGHDVLVLHVVADFETAVRRVINRAKDMGRVVALENLALNHIQARTTFWKLRDSFLKSVSFEAITTRPDGPTVRIELAHLKKEPAMEFDALRKLAFGILSNEFKSLKTTHPQIEKALRQFGTRIKRSPNGTR